MYVFVFQALLAVFLYLGKAEIIQRSALFNTKENARVDAGNIIKRQRTRSLVSCTQECLSEPLCASFNYDSSSEKRRFCELYTDGEEATLTQEPGWLCGYLLDKRESVKRKFEKL